MKRFLLILLLIPVLSWSQSKRKKRLAEEKANMVLLTNLQSHVKTLAGDDFEGRRAGTPGEQKALQYIVGIYQKMGLEPKGTNGYIQPFEINEGKQIDDKTYLRIGEQVQIPIQGYFPLPYSPNRHITGKPAMILNEANQPWFLDLKEILEENKTNPHFDIEAWLRKEVDRVANKDATALFLYNTSDLNDNMQFNKNDKSDLLRIPVIYLTKPTISKYFADNAATIAIDLNVSLSVKTRQSYNVIGFINNHAPTTVILGAHYDHLGLGEDKNALDTLRSVHNGADDNASGTAALIELARMLKNKPPGNNNYLIIHFSGEELGLLGSKYWIEHPSIAIAPNYMLNMDMVGRYDTAHKLTVGGYGTSPIWSDAWKRVKTSIVTRFDSTGSGPSDHASFYRSNIPVQFFFTGSHPDYHKTTDDWDKINYEAQREIVKLAYQLITIVDDKGKLTFAKTAEPQTGRSNRFTVSLGVIPDYGYTGTGMRIDGVSQGKVAERAGLQAGDILLQLGDYKFIDVSSYMQALGKFKKGDKTQLRVRRGSEEKEFEIEF